MVHKIKTFSNICKCGVINRKVTLFNCWNECFSIVLLKRVYMNDLSTDLLYNPSILQSQPDFHIGLSNVEWHCVRYHVTLHLYDISRHSPCSFDKYVCIYIYIHACVCVCVCVRVHIGWQQRRKQCETQHANKAVLIHDVSGLGPSSGESN